VLHADAARRLPIGDVKYPLLLSTLNQNRNVSTISGETKRISPFRNSFSGSLDVTCVPTDMAKLIRHFYNFSLRMRQKEDTRKAKCPIFIYSLTFFILNSSLWGYWHCCQSWPIVPASGDSEDDCGEAHGMWIGRGSRSSRRKPAPAPLLSITKSHMTRHGFEPGPPRWEAGD
jgi:hypothetical protein